MRTAYVMIREILRGKSLTRILMNLELSKYSLKGKVLDIGGGNHPSYFKFFKKENYELINIDLKKSNNSLRINLETDKLPYTDNSIDQILLLNVLEHIYNHKLVIQESHRVLKDDGILIGFVPFLVNVHPDPHDYFRYTKECLEKIFKKSGFNNIKIEEVGMGPFAVSFNSIAFLFPRFLKLLFLPFYYFADFVLLKLRPKNRERFPLGYLFVLKK